MLLALQNQCCGSGSQGFDDQKLKKNIAEIFFFTFFCSKIAIYLFLGLYKGRQSYREKPSALKREHPALQKMKNYCFYFSGPFLPSWIWIRIHNTGIYERSHIEFWSLECGANPLYVHAFIHSFFIIFSDPGFTYGIRIQLTQFLRFQN